MRLLEQRLRVEKILRTYRSQVQPGAHFFIGKVEDGEIRGIEEVVVPSETMASAEHGVVFGFLERGRGSDSDLDRHPLVHHVQATSPEFMRKLQEFLTERMRHE